MINLDNYTWEPVYDWSEMKCSIAKQSCPLLVGIKDIDNFVEQKFRDVADKLGVDYAEVEPILKEKNTEFFFEKERLFRQYNRYAITKENPLLIKVELLLKIPKIA